MPEDVPRVQVAGKLMMHQLAHLGTKNLSMGIDAERASVGELTPQQLCIAATTAFNRGVEVMCIPASLLQEFPGMRKVLRSLFSEVSRSVQAVSQVPDCKS